MGTARVGLGKAGNHDRHKGVVDVCEARIELRGGPRKTKPAPLMSRERALHDVQGELPVTWAQV